MEIKGGGFEYSHRPAQNRVTNDRGYGIQGIKRIKKVQTRVDKKERVSPFLTMHLSCKYHTNIVPCQLVRGPLILQGPSRPTPTLLLLLDVGH